MAEQDVKKKSALQVSSRCIPGQCDSAEHLGAAELTALFDIGRAVTSDLSFDRMVAQLEAGIKRLVDADATLFILSDLRNGPEIIGGQDLRRRTPVAGHQDQCAILAADAAATGRTRCQSCVPNSAECRFLPLVRQDGGYHHVVSVPLLRKGKPIGSITALRQNRDGFTATDLRLLETFASIAANAVENSLNYERERRVAETLQANLLPKPEFLIPGFAVGSSYRAATEDSKVGGDVYDIIDLGSGSYGILIADVSGKGINAAVHTAMVKYLARGLLLSSSELPVVLSRLNEAVCRELPPDVFITLFLGKLDAEKRLLTYANAGHDNPLLYGRAKGCCTFCDVTGRALGVAPDSTYELKRVRLASGDMLILYTDGVTEARRGKDFLGVEGLERFVLKNITLPPDELVKRVFSQVVRYTRKRLQDDAALLAIKAL